MTSTDTLLRLLTAPWLTRAVHAAVRAGVFDELHTTPHTPATLATTLGLHPDPLHRLLRTAADLGLLHEHPDGTYTPTPTGELLAADTPGSLRPLALFYDSEPLRRAWDHLDHTLHTATPADEHAHGTAFYQHTATDPHHHELFTAAMAAGSTAAHALADTLDFTATRSITDIGGGNGALLAALLDRHPHLTAVLLDLPHVLNTPHPALTPHLDTGRCTTAPGDFFTHIPAGSDTYLLCRVLHNWTDDQCHRILTHCRAALGETGRLLIIERVINPDTDPTLPLAFDMHMMAITGGRERTTAHYTALLHPHHLHLTAATPLPAGLTALTATPH
ncbi:methyltransferase [Marinactinospora rubrisoli]|uniref:Methyltransferase n=1 Tax=Marinactinospora rubrisoli TaxID=2715399 RepID=A0ABW2KNI4_9ACTN